MIYLKTLLDLIVNYQNVFDYLAITCIAFRFTFDALKTLNKPPQIL